MFEALEQQLAGKESLGSGGVQFIQSLGLALRFMRAHEDVEKNILNPAYLTLGPQGETFVRECSAFHEGVQQPQHQRHKMIGLIHQLRSEEDQGGV